MRSPHSRRPGPALTAGLLPIGAAQPVAAARRAPTATISSSVTTTNAVAVTFTVKFSTDLLDDV